MNELLDLLRGGDIRSDGPSDEVVEIVLANKAMFEDLLHGLSISDDVIRGRSADALEKIARSKPEWLVSNLPTILTAAKRDDLAMVRWHMAMVLGHLAMYDDKVIEICTLLLDLLEDESTFVRSWAIVSLCIVARGYPELREEVVQKVSSLDQDTSPAIRSKVHKAMELLTDECVGFPKGWIKSASLIEKL